MSTEHQQYSTDNQLDVIKVYAARQGFEIVRLYSDEGKSGLNLQGRGSLGQMIADVQSGAVDFEHILVYDISRWGRFQDTDESAHYEYICRRAGIAIHYCAEQFTNDGSPSSTIIKSVKRAMAAEYSRELSTKVFQGACRLIRLGFKQGGAAGYGLRRALVDQGGHQKAILSHGEHKSIQTDRVILVPGPPEEVSVIKNIYSLFLTDRKSERQIAEFLNARGLKTDLNRQWTRGTVHAVLTNEKYIGNNVYHRTSFKLKKKHVINPPDEWIRASGVFAPIIEPSLFHAAQEIILARSRRFTDIEMLDLLKGLFIRHGKISGILIDEHEGLPSSSAFRHRFGSLVRAYQLIGYTPETDYAFIQVNKRLRDKHPKIVATVLEKLSTVGGAGVYDKESGILWVNQELRVSIVLCRHTETQAGASRWLIRLDEGAKPDITVAVRMTTDNALPLDYYLFPAIDVEWKTVRMAQENGITLDAYRFDTLDQFYYLARRVAIPEVA